MRGSPSNEPRENLPSWVFCLTSIKQAWLLIAHSQEGMTYLPLCVLQAFLNYGMLVPEGSRPLPYQRPLVCDESSTYGVVNIVLYIFTNHVHSCYSIKANKWYHLRLGVSRLKKKMPIIISAIVVVNLIDESGVT